MDKENLQPIRDGDEPLSNHSRNPSFAAILEARLSRRNVLKGSLGGAVLGMFSAPALAKQFLPPQAQGRPPFGANPALVFTAVPVSRLDVAVVPPGYTAKPFLPWGTPISGNYPEFDPVNASNSGEEQEHQVGMHHDGMHYFPIDLKQGGTNSKQGILCVNHEYVEQRYLHPNGATVVDGVRTVPDEVRKEIAAHGVSVVHIRKEFSGDWSVVRSRYNRRITAGTPMEITGPVRRSDLVKTKHSPDGTMTRGTINNCAHGHTPWGTYLTCEENWAGYFTNNGIGNPREHSRYGVPTDASRYSWDTVSHIDEYARFDASSQGADATQYYRNEPNCFGWIVEIDPWDPHSTPKKRTALGRFAHEGCWLAPPQLGQPLVFYTPRGLS